MINIINNCYSFSMGFFKTLKIWKRSS